MHMSRLSKLFVIGLTSALLMANGLSAAFAAGPSDRAVRVRGTVVALAGDQLQVSPETAKPLTVTLKSGWVVSAAAKAGISTSNLETAWAWRPGSHHQACLAIAPRVNVLRSLA